MSPVASETLYKVAVEIFREPEIRVREKRTRQYAGMRRASRLPLIAERTKTVPTSLLADELARALHLATVTYAGHRAHVSCTRVHVTVDRSSLGDTPEEIYP